MDKILIKDIILFADNDFDLYQKLINMYLPNLAKKKKKGVFDRNKAIILLLYYVEIVWKKYKKETKMTNVKLFKNEKIVIADYYLTYLEELL